MENNRELPVGIQDFEKLRRGGCLYVDKTGYIYQLTRSEKPYFLGRPRRFGKSLLITTLKAYFLGKKELFEGLAVEALEKEWTAYPVFHIDFNGANYGGDGMSALRSHLNSLLHDFEAKWQCPVQEGSDLSARFRNLIQYTCEHTGLKVVVLIDEYDKPLLETMDNPQRSEEFRTFFKGFYGVIKGSDAYLRFVMLTGVTKFSQVSIFSDLNQLVDISMDEEYAGICGISETELLQHFEPEIRTLAKKQKMSYKATLAELKKRYDGYHFAMNSEGMYNPFSLLNTFNSQAFRDYWFKTGTPTFLVKMLKNADFDIRKLENDITISARSVTDYRADNSNPIPVLYQSGYLTIKGYRPQYEAYTLGFPNGEVEYAFLSELLPLYVPSPVVCQDFWVGTFIDELLAGEVDSFMGRLRALFADIPYDLNDTTEKHYHYGFYLIFKLMGQFVLSEVHSARGRADAVVVAGSTVYVFECKITEQASAVDALRQISDRGYHLPYATDGRKVVKVGAEFSAEERTIKRWLVG
ncbi:MAG: ATP-binding protein [Prevotellaceae bacterium]|jgi:hypothetical protein|nr:ATP-binding protein [Prevotellaceae bacterium]